MFSLIGFGGVLGVLFEITFFVDFVFDQFLTLGEGWRRTTRPSEADTKKTI